MISLQISDAETLLLLRATRALLSRERADVRSAQRRPAYQARRSLVIKTLLSLEAKLLHASLQISPKEKAPAETGAKAMTGMSRNEEGSNPTHPLP